jgi:hypothetical protein
VKPATATFTYTKICSRLLTAPVGTTVTRQSVHGLTCAVKNARALGASTPLIGTPGVSSSDTVACAVCSSTAITVATATLMQTSRARN